jgi:hypothetical protein
MNELEERNVGCIPAVHDFRADHTLCCITFAFGNLRTRYRVKGSTMRAEESVTFRSWSDVRHTDLPPDFVARHGIGLTARGFPSAEIDYEHDQVTDHRHGAQQDRGEPIYSAIPT